MLNTFDTSDITPVTTISPGITDLSDQQTLLVENGKITVKAIAVTNLEGDITLRGDLKIYGILDAGRIRTTEIIANQRYEKQYIEFAQDNEQGTNVGTGFLWPSKPYNKQLVYRNNPDRFFMTENVEISKDKSFMIDGKSVINSYSLGSSVITSSLTEVGSLKNLVVIGDVNFNDTVFFQSNSRKFSIGNSNPTEIFSVYDSNNDAEVVISGDETGKGRIGTRNNKGLNIITDDQARITIESNGNINLGQELRDSTVVRAYGKLSVGVKNPTEQFEVSGNIKFANKLMTTGPVAPTSGSYRIGDIVWNSDPKPTGFVGWICIATGSPGVWKSFGQITA